MVERYGVDRATLADLLRDEPGYRVDQVWQGLYTQARPVEDLTALPKRLREDLAARLPESLTLAAEVVSDDGATVKWLWTLPDGAQVETVLMLYPERATVCVSTQAGCAMACEFCATGQAGFERNLTTAEIVEQVIRAARRAECTRPSHRARLSNVVFMGMGEPMANYARTWSAVERIHDHIGISARHITVSTVGIVPGIRRLATEALPVNLAVSLHAANDELRDRLVPVNRRYPLGELRSACEAYLDRRNRRLSFEWALIDGVNDRARDARELAELARPLAAHVNLIPLNPTPGYRVSPTPADGVERFRTRLRGLGVNVTVRQNRGVDIDAACGQLRASTVRGPRQVSTVSAPARSSSG